MRKQLPADFTEELWTYYRTATNEAFNTYIVDNMVTQIYKEITEGVHVLESRGVNVANPLAGTDITTFLSDDDVDAYLQSDRNIYNINIETFDGLFRLGMRSKSIVLVVGHPQKRLLVLLAILFYSSRIVFDIDTYTDSMKTRRETCIAMDAWEEYDSLFDSEEFDDPAEFDDEEDETKPQG